MKGKVLSRFVGSKFPNPPPCSVDTNHRSQPDTPGIRRSRENLEVIRIHVRGPQAAYQFSVRMVDIDELAPFLFCRSPL